MDLSVVIVSWNVRDLLRRALSSLLVARYSLLVASNLSSVDWSSRATSNEQPATRMEIIVVDNASSDGSAQMVAAEFPQIRLLRNDTNLGFTRANNQGLAVSRGRYVLFLNPDTEVVGDALHTMVTYMDTRPDVGVLGPQLRYPDGSIQPSRRRFPTLATAFLESTLLEQWWPDNPAVRHYRMADCPDEQEQDVDWVVGAALLARREVLDTIGGFDEGFFMYSEELDWCKRAKAAGWRVVYLPSAKVIHYEGKSSEQVVAARHIHFQTSKLRYFRKYHGPLAASLLRWFLLTTYAFQWGEEAAKWLVGHKRPLRRERLAAYGQVLRSRLLYDAHSLDNWRVPPYARRRGGLHS